VQCGVEIWANVCMHVCMFVTCLVIGSRVSIMRTNPRDNAQHVLYKHFVMVLMWRDTDEMPLKSSETADSRVIGGGEWSPTSTRRTYVAPSIWRVNLSDVLKKLRNTGSTPTFDSIFRYQHSHHLSMERLD